MSHGVTPSASQAPTTATLPAGQGNSGAITKKENTPSNRRRRDQWQWDDEDHSTKHDKGNGKGKGGDHRQSKDKGKGKGKDGKGKGKDGKGKRKYGTGKGSVVIGSSAHKLRTTETETRVQFGSASVSKAALAKIIGCGPNDRCWSTAMSTMDWP